ncbi:MAG: PilZ domain-containing protein [Candidatus Acidiferrum sp.]
MQTFGQEYRRRSRRLKMSQPLMVRPLEPQTRVDPDIGATQNVSREGFYFHTTRDSYVEGMRLSVVLPYHSLNDSRNREFIGQVVRVETLSNGQFGVAIRLLSAAPLSG